MICKNCGAQITDEAKFCPMCGASQTAPAEEPNEPVKPELVFAEPLKEEEPEVSEYIYTETESPAEEDPVDDEEEEAAKETVNSGYVRTSPGRTEQADSPSDPPLCGMAVAGFVLSFFFVILGIIFSAVGLSQCSQRELRGKGLAIAGLVISIVSLFFRILVLIAVLRLGVSAFYYYW